MEVFELAERSVKSAVEAFVIVDPGRPGFKEYVSKCKKAFGEQRMTILEFPGTVNGKTTYCAVLRSK